MQKSKKIYHSALRYVVVT